MVVGFTTICNQWLSPLKLWFPIPLMARCTRYNIIYVIKLVCDLQQVSGFPVFTTNKTDCKDITEILLKVVLDIINQFKPNQILHQEGIPYPPLMDTLGSSVSWVLATLTKQKRICWCKWKEILQTQLLRNIILIIDALHFSHHKVFFLLKSHSRH